MVPVLHFGLLLRSCLPLNGAYAERILRCARSPLSAQQSILLR